MWGFSTVCGAAQQQPLLKLRIYSLISSIYIYYLQVTHYLTLTSDFKTVLLHIAKAAAAIGRSWLESIVIATTLES